MKIKSEKVTAYMGKDFVADTMSGKYTYKVGTSFDARRVGAGGVEVIEGHGISHGIPRDCFTKFVRTWKEVETLDGTTTSVAKKEDVTDEYTNWFLNYDKRVAVERDNQLRVGLKHRIAKLKADIKFVKSGKAEAELNERVAELDKLL